jgi:hypothetical protein
MSAAVTIAPSKRKKTIFSGPHRMTTTWVIIFVMTGVLYRLYLTSVLPVGYDEVKVMAVGLEEMTESVGKTLIEVPVRRSNGITPLWWWFEYALTGNGRAISLLTLRVARAVGCPHVHQQSKRLFRVLERSAADPRCVSHRSSGGGGGSWTMPARFAHDRVGEGDFRRFFDGTGRGYGTVGPALLDAEMCIDD